MDPLTGKTLAGKYVIQTLLGEGGMGRVYLGEVKPTGRKVAIKLLQESLCEDPVLVRRFEREAKIQSRITHQNSVALLDFGRDEMGLYLVMEYLEGETLWDRFCAEGILDPNEVVSILCRVSGALSVCHAQGMVHRDLKPDNIMLCHHDGEIVPKLLDFGIARQNEGPAVTRTGQIVGTPYYMSPEQIIGKGVGPASDIYALGVLLFELLSGRLPFEETSHLDLFRKHICAPVPLLSFVTGDASLSPFDAVVQKALQKTPSERFVSVDAFAQALLDALLQWQRAGAPVLCVPTELSLLAVPHTLSLQDLALPVSPDFSEWEETQMDEEPQTHWGSGPEELEESFLPTRIVPVALPHSSFGQTTQKLSSLPSCQDTLSWRMLPTEKMPPVPEPPLGMMVLVAQGAHLGFPSAAKAGFSWWFKSFWQKLSRFWR